MAIEQVLIYNNTSVIQDEVLAHRIGLIPPKANPTRFKFKSDPSAEPNDEDTLEFELKVRCKLPSRNADKYDKSLYIDSRVLTSHLKWNPIGNQATKFAADELLPIHNDILLAKMNPGQELDLKLLAVKGIGKDHAKFSPVATAYYKLLNEIVLHEEFYGEQAERLQRCFSPGVIELVDDPSQPGVKKAVVANARLDMCSRQVFMHDEFKESVELHKIRNHFIFSIESTGAMSCADLFIESMNILAIKSQKFLAEIRKTKEND